VDEIRDVQSMSFLPRVAAQWIPEGMKVMVIHSGVFGWMTWLMGLGIHAQHSFEDKIRPGEDVYRHWGVA
jgi:hypothetical protein